MRWRVVVEEPCLLRTEYLVEANAAEDAEALALDRKQGGVVDYEYLLTPQPRQIVSVKAVEEPVQ